MSLDDGASLLYLGLLAILLLGSYLVASRARMGLALAQAATWALIFMGVIVAFGLWPRLKETLAPRQAAVVTAGGAAIEVPRGMDGHYRLTLLVNGAPILFTVDTGATEMVLSRRDARLAGLDPEGLRYAGTALTANGVVRTARVTLDQVSLEGVTDASVPAVVTESDMEGSLLGMTYLERFSRLEIADGRLILTR